MGEHFIKKKDEWAKVLSQFEKQEIGSRECFIRECNLVEDFDKAEFDRITDSQELDPYFGQFMHFCNSNGLKPIILSEGMDYYIERILSKNGYDIPFYANKFILSDDEKSFGLEFPFADSDCELCGCCKRNIMLNQCSDDEIAVYIGDGLTDVCVADYADIVFAKGLLASYCWKNNITYFDYNNFGDIVNKLEKLLVKSKIQHRQTARLKRRDAYLRG